MNTQQACNELGITPGTSIDDVDKAFKKLALQYHPDRNQNDKENAEIKFKQINEAYQFLKKNGTTVLKNDFHTSHYSWTDSKNGFWNDFNDIFPNTPYKQKIHAKINISFVESIVGCEKTINISRKTLCKTCAGTGLGDINCQKCKSTGKMEAFGKEVPCTACHGTTKNKTQKCNNCFGAKLISEDITTKVKIPALFGDDMTIIVPNKGDYNLKFLYYFDAVCAIEIEPHDQLTRLNNDVISSIEITLLEALKGCTKSVCTAYGEKSLKIKPLIKNSEQIRVKGFGVGNSNSHIFNIKVNYPDNVNEIIELLENNNQTENQEEQKEENGV